MLEPPDFQDQLETLDHRAIRDRPVSRVLLVLQDHQVQVVNLDHQVFKVPVEDPELLVNKAQVALLDFLANQAKVDKEEAQDNLVSQAVLVNQVLQDQMEMLVRLVKLVPLDL